MRYYKQDYVDLKAGFIVMASFLLFSFIGAHIAIHLPSSILKIFLGIVLLLMGTKLIVSGWAAIS
jgi:uncharacterized membrane protein YfcA